MANIIQKSANNQPLAPSQRALLRLGKSLAIAAFVTLTAVLTQALLTGKPIDSTLIYSGLMASGYAVLSALQKYFSAIGDTEMTQALSAGMEVDSAAFKKFNSSSGGMNMSDLVNQDNIARDVAPIAAEYNSSMGEVPQQDNTPQSNSTDIASEPEVIEGISADSALPTNAQ